MTGPESIKKDIDLHAFNLNVALIKYKQAGMDFEARRSLAYMLAATELYLKEEEAETKPPHHKIPPTCPDCGHTVCLCHRELKT